MNYYIISTLRQRLLSITINKVQNQCFYKGLKLKIPYNSTNYNIDNVDFHPIIYKLSIKISKSPHCYLDDFFPFVLPPSFSLIALEQASVKGSPIASL